MLANPNISLLGEIVSQATTGLRNVNSIKTSSTSYNKVEYKAIHHTSMKLITKNSHLVTKQCKKASDLLHGICLVEACMSA